MSTISFPFAPGAALPTLTLPAVTRLDLIKYAGASGDFNPIHTIDAAAEAAGLPGVIQHGMLTAAKICRLFSPYLADGFVSLIELRFAAMVSVGDVLTMTGTVTEVSATGDAQSAGVEVFARNQNNQVVVSGLMEFTELVKPRAG
jgi:acyl dehydratase